MSTNNANISQFYGNFFTEHGKLFGSPICEIVEYMRAHLKIENVSTRLHDEESTATLLEKVKLHNTDTNHALKDHDLRLLRQGIADQLAAVYSFAYSVSELEKPCTKQFSLMIPNSYADYCSAVNDSLEALIELPLMIESHEMMKAVDHLVANLINLPDFSRFSIENDFADMALFKLSGKGPFLSYINENTVWK